jgi:hypothetical protein
MEIQAASRRDQAVLGQGYNAFEEEFAGQCVTGGRTFAGISEARLRFDRSLDQSETSKELGFEVGAKVRYGLFSASLAAQFASSSSASAYSDVTVYSHVVNLKNEVLDFQGLTEEGERAKGSSEGPFVSEFWPRTCGHQFVSQITLGAKLLVAITVSFATRREKTEFSAEFNLKGPPLEVQASLKTAAAKFGKRASLSIQAYQLGGKPERLSRIFGTGGAMPIILVSLDNPTAVTDLLAQVVAYSRDDFPNQIDPSIPSNAPGGPAQLSYIVKSWDALALFTQPAMIAAGVELARRNLSDAFERQAQYQQRLRQLLSGPMRLSRSQFDRLTLMNREVARNLADIQQAAMIAYSDAARAADAVASTIEGLQEFAPEEFDVEPESFAQWFDIRNLPTTLRDTKQTLDHLVSKFRDRFNNFEAIPDDQKGEALQNLVENIDELSIDSEDDRRWVTGPLFSIVKDNKIKKLAVSLQDLPLEILERFTSVEDLRLQTAATEVGALRHLTRLSSLELSGPVVDDITPIAGLTNLRNLQLFAPVLSVSPLGALRELTSLTIMMGRFADLAPLQGLIRLTELLLESATIEDVSPLSQLTELRTLGVFSRQLRRAESLAALRKLRVLRLSGPVQGLSWLERLPELQRLDLSTIPDQDLTPLSRLPRLTELSINTFELGVRQITTVFSNVKVLGPNLSFRHLFLDADRIAVTEGDLFEGTWTRRSDSSAFDARWVDRRTGAVHEGPVAIEDVGIFADKRTIRLKGLRDGRALLYSGDLTSDPNRVGQGLAMWFDTSGALLPDGHPERAVAFTAARG